MRARLASALSRDEKYRLLTSVFNGPDENDPLHSESPLFGELGEVSEVGDGAGDSRSTNDEDDGSKVFQIDSMAVGPLYKKLDSLNGVGLIQGIE